MGYKPERALTRGFIIINVWERIIVEMGYKPERALTQMPMLCASMKSFDSSRNGV